MYALTLFAQFLTTLCSAFCRKECTLHSFSRYFHSLDGHHRHQMQPIASRAGRRGANRVQKQNSAQKPIFKISYGLDSINQPQLEKSDSIQLNIESDNNALFGLEQSPEFCKEKENKEKTKHKSQNE